LVGDGLAGVHLCDDDPPGVEGLALDDPDHLEEIHQTIGGPGRHLAGDEDEVGRGDAALRERAKRRRAIDHDELVLPEDGLEGARQEIFALGALLERVGDPLKPDVGGHDVEARHLGFPDEAHDRDRRLRYDSRIFSLMARFAASSSAAGSDFRISPSQRSMSWK
jgi:hypothetical protein